MMSSEDWRGDELAWWELVMETDFASYEDIAREVGAEYALWLQELEEGGL